MRDIRDAILDAALDHVAFDGWSDATLTAAARDTEVPQAEARALFPRGGVDLALAYHQRGDGLMAERIAAMPGDGMAFRERIAAAVRARIDVISDKEAVRRGSSLFALPQHAADGAKAVWGTADRIWTALGDSSTDINWYTKRGTLAGVYGATVLYWLGDTSPDHRETNAFIDRRIGDVMQIEKAKAAVNANPLLRTAFAGPNWLLSRVRAPSRIPRADLPGRWGGRL